MLIQRNKCLQGQRAVYVEHGLCEWARGTGPQGGTVGWLIEAEQITS